MLVQIVESLLQSFHVRFLDQSQIHASVHLQSLSGSHEHSQLRSDTRLAAFDIIEFLRTQIGAESSFGDDIVTIGHGQTGCQHGVTSVSDIGKRTAVYESRCVLGGLHQIRMQGIFQQHTDGSGHAHILHAERFVVDGSSEQNVFDAATQILFILCQTENGHDFRSRSNVETALHSHAVCLGSQAGYDVTQVAVVHVEHALPQNLLHGKAFVLVLVDIVVQQSRNHVVSRSDGMEVTGEMQVDLVHREHLSISSSGSSSLHSEARAE